MRFHGFVRGALGRLAAALLVALLAGPAMAPSSPSLAGEHAASSTHAASSAHSDGAVPAHNDGMAPTPTHAASAVLAIAAAGVAAPPASPRERVRVSFQPLPCRIVTDITSRLPATVRPAPAVLRV
jgi:hypothetical protein